MDSLKRQTVTATPAEPGASYAWLVYSVYLRSSTTVDMAFMAPMATVSGAHDTNRSNLGETSLVTRHDPLASGRRKADRTPDRRQSDLMAL